LRKGKDSNISMQLSGGQLLDSGSTESTLYGFPYSGKTSSESDWLQDAGQRPVDCNQFGL